MVSLLSPTVPVLCDMLCWEDIYLLLSACEMKQGDCNKLSCSLRRGYQSRVPVTIKPTVFTRLLFLYGVVNIYCCSTEATKPEQNLLYLNYSTLTKDTMCDGTLVWPLLKFY